MEPLEEALIQEILGLKLAAYDIVIMEKGENHSRAQALCDISFNIFKSDSHSMDDFRPIFIVDSQRNKHSECG